jgi:hypothetical protein
MSNELKGEYLRRMVPRYQKANRGEKTLMLNEFCFLSEYSRGHAKRLLSRGYVARKKRPGPKPKYNPEITRHLRELWIAMERISAKRLKQALPIWLEFYNDATAEVKTQLISMSASTIERRLEEIRPTGKGGLSTTRPDPSFKTKIPLKNLGEEIKGPGTLEADTVAHCGNVIGGNYVNSITAVDMATQWTENRAVWTKDSKRIREATQDIETHLPFELLCWDTDCGSEFLNYRMTQYFYHRPRPIRMRRSRPYKKNDNAHVEQKNYTHVRQLFGYERIDDEKLVVLMNEIYRSYWNPLQNFFLPSFRLKEKIRVGAKIIKKYEPPKTAYQRLQDSAELNTWRKRKLRGEYKRLNPFELKRGLEEKLKLFFSELKKSKLGRVPQ